MCKILNVYPKDTYVVIEFSQKQVKFILDFLGRCKIEYDGMEEPDIKEAVDYMTGSFFDRLTNAEDLIKEIQHGA